MAGWESRISIAEIREFFEEFRKLQALHERYMRRVLFMKPDKMDEVGRKRYAGQVEQCEKMLEIYYKCLEDLNKI